TLYWPDLSGNTLNESSLGATNLHEYVYCAGKRVARIDVPTPLTVKYYFSDHLGSASVITNASGAILDESDYYPYGGEIVVTNNDSNNYKFTGKERDAESGLDNFGARYDSSSLGRFMTPDWAAKPTTVPYAVFGDPQSLNLYAYVENAPVNRADADAHSDPPPMYNCAYSSQLPCTQALWPESSACSLSCGSACANGSAALASSSEQNEFSLKGDLQEAKNEIVNALTTKEGFKKAL